MSDFPRAETVSLQDRDLLSRLSHYFANLEARLREGQGWLILNSDRIRTYRIVNYMLANLAQYALQVVYHHLPWRDLAITAYVSELELPQQVSGGPEDERRRKEMAIATRVSHNTLFMVKAADLLILSGVEPRHPHELQYLLEALEARLQRGLTTILITPLRLEELAGTVARLSSARTWDELFSKIYRTSLIAL
jgi:hypothetical protein